MLEFRQSESLARSNGPVQDTNNHLVSWRTLKLRWKYTVALNYFLLVVLGLCCYTQACSCCSEWRLLFVVCASFSLQWLLLLWSTGSRHMGLVADSIWNLPGPGMEVTFTGRQIPIHSTSPEPIFSRNKKIYLCNIFFGSTIQKTLKKRKWLVPNILVSGSI